MLDQNVAATAKIWENQLCFILWLGWDLSGYLCERCVDPHIKIWHELRTLFLLNKGSQYHSLHLKILYKLLIWQKNFSFPRVYEQITDSRFLKIDLFFLTNHGKRFAAWLNTKNLIFHTLTPGLQIGWPLVFKNAISQKPHLRFW